MTPTSGIHETFKDTVHGVIMFQSSPPNLDNLEDGEREGGAPEDPPGGGEVALVDDAPLAAGVLNIEAGG